MLIFMMRHGMPEFPDDRDYVYGQTDYPLSAAGEDQARRAGLALENTGMQRIVSSDLLRAVRTAEIVAEAQRENACEVEQDQGLREIHMGYWEGLPVDDVEIRFRDEFLRRGRDIANVAPLGGESFVRLQERGVKAFDRIINDSPGLERILLVAHAGILWSIVSDMFGLPIGGIFNYAHDYCGLHIIERRFGDAAARWGNYRLVRYNWFPDPTAAGLRSMPDR
ncbi:MAG: histidine phosphatase family protein [Synergistaceae bacterium]|jgi:probable phosphoglycerate mutase|nr:histidine phosphatase family protein [Synergistaceae bacterium]